MLNENSQNSLKFCCDTCNYNTSNKKDYNKHLLTLKHSKLTNNNIIVNGLQSSSQTECLYKCNCGKEYRHMSSLCKHKKKCNTNSEINNNCDKELLVFIIKEMQDMKQMINKQNEIIAQQNIIIEQIKHKEL
jgi:hypothetical protein